MGKHVDDILISKREVGQLVEEQLREFQLNKHWKYSIKKIGEIVGINKDTAAKYIKSYLLNAFSDVES